MLLKIKNTISSLSHHNLTSNQTTRGLGDSSNVFYIHSQYSSFRASSRDFLFLTLYLTLYLSLHKY
jgi:hypothetical protein